METSAMDGLPNKSTHPAEHPPNAAISERATKRIRLSGESHATIAIREADKEVALEVDHMILDYLAFQANEACLAHYGAPMQSEDLESTCRKTCLVDRFLAIFKARHANYKFDPGLEFRLLLLKLVTLMGQRHVRTTLTPPVPSLAEWRERNKERARRWIGVPERVPSASHDPEPFDTDPPLSGVQSAHNRAQVLSILGYPAEEEQGAYYGTDACVSLLDLLPIFMELSAACQSIFDIEINEEWMGLARQWMLQACLEQYLIYGEQGTDVIDEAFAWGYDNAQSAQDTDISTTKVSEMFSTDTTEDAPVSHWETIKASTVAQLFPTSIQSQDRPELISHLRALAEQYPIAGAEDSIFDFLQNLSKATTDPVLVQLEKGRLDGMTEKETVEFLQNCGLSASKILTEGIIDGNVVSQLLH